MKINIFYCYLTAVKLTAQLCNFNRVKIKILRILHPMNVKKLRSFYGFENHIVNIVLTDNITRTLLRGYEKLNDG